MGAVISFVGVDFFLFSVDVDTDKAQDIVWFGESHA